MTDAPSLYNSRLFNNYLEYLEKHHPDISLEHLLAESGIGRAEVEDPGHWLNQEQINGFHRALGRKINDPHLAREVGRFTQASRTAGILARSVLGFMTPMMAYRAMGKVASEWTRATEYTIRPVSDREITLAVTPRPGVKEQPFQCDNRIGMLEALAKVFTGQYARIEHPTCIHRGGASCDYHISWQPLLSNRLKRWLRFGTLGALFTLVASASFLPLGTWLVEMTGWGVLLGLGATLAVAMENRELKRSIAQKGEIADRDLKDIRYRYSGAFLIQEIGKAASVLQPPEAFADAILSILQKRLDYTGGMLWLIDEDQPERLKGNGFGVPSEVLEFLRDLPLDAPEETLGGLLELVCRRGVTVVVDQPREIQRQFPGFHAYW